MNTVADNYLPLYAPKAAAFKFRSSVNGLFFRKITASSDVDRNDGAGFLDLIDVVRLQPIFFAFFTKNTPSYFARRIHFL